MGHCEALKRAPAKPLGQTTPESTEAESLCSRGVTGWRPCPSEQEIFTGGMGDDGYTSLNAKLRCVPKVALGYLSCESFWGLISN
jgi:hypothetical protein